MLLKRLKFPRRRNRKHVRRLVDTRKSKMAVKSETRLGKVKEKLDFMEEIRYSRERKCRKYVGLIVI